MTSNKNQTQAIRLSVTDGLTVTLHQNPNHNFLMSAREVAAGYGVCVTTIRKHCFDHKDEISEGVHFVKGVTISNTLANAQPHQIFWTKAGVIRLGFFIKSERAKLFRDWAEDLVISVADRRPSSPVPAVVKPKYRSNRLTPERVADLLSDVCQIENSELRRRIAAKIVGGQSYGN